MDSERSSAPDHPDLTVHFLGKRVARVRKTYLLSGSSPGNLVKCYNKTILGMERALKERLFYIPAGDGWVPRPTHERGYVLSTLSESILALKNFSRKTHPLDRLEYSLSFGGQKQKRYLKASESLGRTGILRKHAILKFFMKFEAYNLHVKGNPSPRGINPPSDEYLVELGRYIKPIEKLIYKALRELFGFIVSQGIQSTTTR
uniref:RNA-dependent RNA polymerase n=1 Tax=Riboviria sp. TaxID=2585031 RepID=A0A514D349_9VIRU|nr:MAG: RNA-dependent RNA polymerase [Riboviria sp.]